MQMINKHKIETDIGEKKLLTDVKTGYRNIFKEKKINFIISGVAWSRAWTWSRDLDHK